MLNNDQKKIILAALEFIETGLGDTGMLNSFALDAMKNVGANLKTSADDISAIKQIITNSHTPKVLVTVSGGVADFIHDNGADLHVFDFDDYDDDPDSFKASVPLRFKYLAENMKIPDDAISDEAGIPSTGAGKIWQIADNAIEAEQWKTELLAKGADHVELKTEINVEQVDVIITLDRARATEILGYDVEESEWLDESVEDDDETILRP